MDKFVISLPLKIIFPESGFSIPIIILASVDFPEPFGPVITTILSLSILKFTFFKMCLLSLEKQISCNSNILPPFFAFSPPLFYHFFLLFTTFFFFIIVQFLKQGDTQFVSKLKQIVCPLVSVSFMLVL